MLKNIVKCKDMNNLSKKYLFLAFFLCLSFTITGCGGGDNVKPDSKHVSSKKYSKKHKGLKIYKTAKTMLGKEYCFGGKSPKTGFDCSGLAWWSHKTHKITIPRSSKAQFHNGRKIKKSRLQPGDLVFFETYKPGPSHVGIYNGNGHFIHSPNSKDKVKITKMKNSYYKARYLGARRYW